MRSTERWVGVRTWPASAKWRLSRNVVSAGGLSVCAHIASPTAHDLFQRAITESGPCTAPLPTLATAEGDGSAVAARLGCGDPATQVSCMRAQAVADVLAAGGAFRPNVDGSLLPQQIPAAISSGKLNRVPVIEGTNHDEDRLFVALQFDLAGKPVTAEQYPPWCRPRSGARRRRRCSQPQRAHRAALGPATRRPPTSSSPSLRTRPRRSRPSPPTITSRSGRP